MLNLSILLEESARQFPDKDAIVFDQIRLTYKQVDAMANQLANGLTKAGVRRGDKVRILPPRGSVQRADQRLWRVKRIDGEGEARMAVVELIDAEAPELSELSPFFTIRQ